MKSADWPLTGRGEELRAVAGALRDTGGVVLAGSAGVGKTRLAREAIAAASEGTARWVLGSLAAQSVPLGAFASLTGGAADPAPDAGALARVSAALRGGRVVLGVDDAHLLDMVSAALLHQLASDRSVRLVVTLRTGEQAPDAVTALWKDGLLERVEVGPLSQAQTADLLAAALGGRTDELSVGRLYSATGGNTLWLRHLVDGERAAGRLADTTGVWHWPGAPQLSPALGGLIEAQIGELSPDAREVLELLALGEPLGVEVLTTLTGATAVEETAERGLVRLDAGERRHEVRLAHPLYGEAVRANISVIRARRLRGLLADVLAGSSARRSGDSLRRAMLLADSDQPPDPAVLLEGASQATAVGDVVVAERLARAARDAGGGFEPQLLLAFGLYWWMRGEEAEPEFAAAAELAANDHDRIRTAFPRICNVFGVLDRPQDAQAILDAADRVMTDPALAVELDAGRAVLAVLGDEVPAARALTQRVLDTPGASDVAVSYASWAGAIMAAMQGWSPASGEMIERGYRACSASGETAPLALNMGYQEVAGLALAGRLDIARANVGRFADMAPSIRFMVNFFSAPIELASGHVATTARMCRDARPYVPGKSGGWTEIMQSLLCQAHAMAGNATDAAAALAEAMQWRQTQFRVLEPMLGLARAWVSAAEGAVTEAIELATKAADMAGRSQHWAFESGARHTAVCFGDIGQAERLAELAGQLSLPRPIAAAAHAAALAAEDPAGLILASTQLEELGLLLLAADAAAQAAVLHRRREETGDANIAAARAAELAQRCEGARTPALIASATPLPITTREREVAALAAGGLTNKEIAERLHVSVRTVEGHVYRACAKLGVADRAALAELVASPAR